MYDYFGKEAAEKFGDMIVKVLAEKQITKRKDKANEPGGLIYEAEQLGIGMWDLLEALEGLCVQNRAIEVDDSTYKILQKGTSNKNRLFLSENVTQ